MYNLIALSSVHKLLLIINSNLQEFVLKIYGLCKVYKLNLAVLQVSIFLKDKVQNSNGRFVLPTSGPVPHGTQSPGLIRYLFFYVPAVAI